MSPNDNPYRTHWPGYWTNEYSSQSIPILKMGIQEVSFLHIPLWTIEGFQDYYLLGPFRCVIFGSPRQFLVNIIFSIKESNFNWEVMEGSPRIMKKILSNKIDLLDSHFYPPLINRHFGGSPPSLGFKSVQRGKHTWYFTLLSFSRVRNMSFPNKEINRIFFP